MRRLEGKIALITGGAGGIGAATGRRLTDEGATVVLADINLQRATTAADEIGRGASAVQYDAEDVASIEAMVATTVERHGRLDILHNNAAITTPEIQLLDTTAPDIPLETWDRVMAVNLRAYLAASKHAIPVMLANGGGAIINTASGSAMVGDLSRIAYGTSKAGILAMTRYIATQHGRQGIRCNAIAPGLILTEASKQAVPELIALISNHVLTPRLGRPEDVAAVVAFLASEDAGFINGETIVCNGGSLAHQPHTHDLANFLHPSA
ncbi:MAG: family oxidoreductase [Phenylobacterium sp.]|nr:family oxidoreductase [Phenylobacterium sp.]